MGPSERLNRFLSSIIVAFSAAALLLMGISAGPANAAFGPPVKNCAKLKKKAAKRACAKQNRDVRKAFAVVANARFQATTFSGTSIDATFCRSGKWHIEAAVPGLDVQVFKGNRWRLEDVTVRPKAIYLNAVGPSRNIFTEVGLQLRGKKWYLSDGNPTLKAPEATRSGAAARCATL